MTDQDERALITDLARDLVAELAPRESEVFEELAAEYFEDPRPPETAQGATDDALGFGLGGMVIAMTPAAAAVVSAVLSFLGSIALEAFRAEGGDYVRNRLRMLFQGDRAPDGSAAVPVSQADLQRLYQVARDEAGKYGLSDADAATLADALFRRLALGN